jgi:hypothetical protein
VWEGIYLFCTVENRGFNRLQLWLQPGFGKYHSLTALAANQSCSTCPLRQLAATFRKVFCSFIYFSHLQLAAGNFCRSLTDTASSATVHNLPCLQHQLCIKQCTHTYVQGWSLSTIECTSDNSQGRRKRGLDWTWYGTAGIRAALRRISTAQACRQCAS